MQRYRPPTFRINRRTPLANGLVFAGLGGGASTNLYADASGYSNHGTLTSMDPATDWVFDAELGRWGTAYGGTKYATVLNSSSINQLCGTGVSRAVSVWLKFTTGSNTVILEKGNNAQFVLQTNTTPNEGKVSFRTNTSAASQAITSTAINDGTWHHIYAEHVAGVNRIYLDGVFQQNRAENAPAANANNLLIGSRSGNFGFPGTLSDLLIMTPRSPAEIQQLADPSNVMLSGMILPPARRLWPVATTGEGSNLIIPHHGMMAM